MARPPSATIVGEREVRLAFQAVEPTMREHLGYATETTSKEIARVAATKVPVRYGNLRKFIAAKYTKRTGFPVVGVRAGTVVIPASFSEIGPGGKVVAPGRYAHLVHWGSVRQRGIPFMLDAARSEQRYYPQRITRAAKDAERELAAKAPKVT